MKTAIWKLYALPFCCVSLAAGFYGSPTFGAEPPGQTNAPPAKGDMASPIAPAASALNSPSIGFGQSTPEETLRSFLIATLYQDIRTLKAVVMPVSDTDFHYLIVGTPPPEKLLSRARSGIASLAIRSFKTGETVDLTRKGSFVVPAGMIGPDLALLLPEGAPTPFFLHRVNGKWLIFADPIIAERKTAEEQRAKQHEMRRMQLL